MTATATELTHQQHTFRWAVDGADDITGRRGPAIVPHGIEVSYDQNKRRSSWRVEVTGSRRLKSGAVGIAPMSIRYYSSNTGDLEMPGWIWELVKHHTPMGWDT